ncbi:MAG: bifunctional precorrin-2 dehydrogenase/sirohydrochlorin ferrochelatase [Sphingobium sp.]|uniref:precorrin-2 dehydrogenase/sirohydrochlorin ferrochelatase family protein n=1 Tax=Sphingobium sp. TaxID=1912891 RepID=UPI0029BA55DA|nr:bifunctional precorrin-2 dehydrogenase/sirohydrochlorin ferrochelatase [Sphingobium sp.]MDX3909193.1 bifunctional precorrin-2 dehydrogenase/sirohydrochlorin ferrochelatase [Sphingobium sp.]
MHSLPLFFRLAGRPVMLVGTGDAADAKRRLLERAGAQIVGEEAQAALAIVAMEEDVEAEAAITRLKARGVLVNAVDRPQHCDFTLPAIVDRDPVLVAVGTGGASAGLAKAVRQRIEALLPASLGIVARTLESLRPAIQARWPSPAQRRRALDAALATGGPLDPLKVQSADAVERWLAAAAEPVTDRMVAITLSSADPDDLTLKTARLMGEADRIYHTADVPPAILIRARADAQRIAAAAAPAKPGPGLSLWLSMQAV